MKNDPLFIRVANRQAQVLDAARAFVDSPDEATSSTARAVAEVPSSYPHNFNDFSTKFRSLLADLIDNGITQSATTALNSYMEPSLTEVTRGINYSTKGSTSEYPIIREASQPWAEGLVCYNLCKYIKAFGIQEIKVCKKCKVFFAGRGKYASYCSDACREGKK